MSSSENHVSKSLIIWLSVISILVVLIILIVFGIFMKKENSKGDEFFDSGSVVMTYDENSEIFFINNMLPLSDEVGKANSLEGQYYDFTVQVNVGDSSAVDYEIALDVAEEFTNSLPEFVKVYLEKQESGAYISVMEPTTFDKLNGKSSIGDPANAKIIINASSNENVSHNYRLRMWLADGTVINPEVLQSFGIEIKVYGKAK